MTKLSPHLKNSPSFNAEIAQAPVDVVPVAIDMPLGNPAASDWAVTAAPEPTVVKARYSLSAAVADVVTAFKYIPLLKEPRF